MEWQTAAPLPASVDGGNTGVSPMGVGGSCDRDTGVKALLTARVEGRGTAG